jgi:hypothetical protein
MKYLLILTILLSGCTNEIRRDFPPIPPSLTTGCEELDLVADHTEKLSEILKVVTSNYAKYHECKIKVDTWTNWYNEQRKAVYIR